MTNIKNKNFSYTSDDLKDDPHAIERGTAIRDLLDVAKVTLASKMNVSILCTICLDCETMTSVSSFEPQLGLGGYLTLLQREAARVKSIILREAMDKIREDEESCDQL